MPLPLVVLLGLILAAMLAVGVIVLILFPAGDKPEQADDENANTRRQLVAAEHDTTAERPGPNCA